MSRKNASINRGIVTEIWKTKGNGTLYEGPNKKPSN